MRMNIFIILFTVFFEIIKIEGAFEKELFNDNICDSIPEFTNDLKNEIISYSSDVQKIIDFVTKGTDKGITYKELAKFCDTFGSRLAGTQNYDFAINYLYNKILLDEKHDRVYTEELPIIKWTRGQEWAQMIKPRVKPLAMFSSGYSVGTNGNIITAPVILIRSVDELNNRSNELKSKIVIYRPVRDRFKMENMFAPPKEFYASQLASKYGALALLIRSGTIFSIYSPHTGVLYKDNITEREIPFASLTVEDIELIERLNARGVAMIFSLYMEAKSGPTVMVKNLISKLNGTQYPEQMVIIGGHSDSWDVGDGAMDNGGGAFLSWRALSVLKKLGLKTKRTLKSILWAAEEFGIFGSKYYVQKHQAELRNISVVMNSDSGTFNPSGLSFSGNNTLSKCIVHYVLQMFEQINATRLMIAKGDSIFTDTKLFIEKGVPTISLDTKNERYFYFHHSNGDTMTVENTSDLDLCTALWTATAYIFANLDYMIPR